MISSRVLSLLVVVVCISQVCALIPLDAKPVTLDHKRTPRMGIVVDGPTEKDPSVTHHDIDDSQNIVVDHEHFRGGQNGQPDDGATKHTGAGALTPGQISATGGLNKINYNGGKVMLGNIPVYLIFYGNFSASTTPKILTDLVGNLVGAAWWTTAFSYFQRSSGVYSFVNGFPQYGGIVYDTSYKYGTQLTDSQIYYVVSNAIGAGKVPLNDNAMYVVLTSQDVNAVSGMCTNYCGWHYSDIISGKSIKYAYIGSPLRCPSSCVSGSITPNGNKEADGMANTLMHELVEMVSDPNVDAWYDPSYMENGDKCAWKFGTTYKTAIGATANTRIGTRDFLLQQNWVNANGGYCGTSFV